MIMQWRKCKSYPEDFKTEWQGIKFYLAQGPRKNDRWYLLADGKLVRQNWHTARAAMEAIDTLQQKLILEAARTHPVAVVRTSALGRGTDVHIRHAQGGSLGS